jgi:pilus assembly protein CpaE
MTDHGIAVLLAHDAGLSGGRIIDHIPKDSGIELAGVVESLSPESAAVQTSDADVLVVACRHESDDALGLIRWWVDHRADRPVVVISEGSPNGFVERAFNAGADDIVVLGAGEDVSPASSQQLLFALRKAVVRRSAPAEGARKTATMVCMFGPKGGVGKTVTACNLALALAERRKRTVLVDLDLQFGDVALSLGIRPESTAYDLATSGGSLDAEKVDAYLISHPTGLRVLPAPVRPDQTSFVAAEFVAEVLSILRSEFEYVIVDTPPTLTPEVIGAIDASTFVCIVGTLDALALKNTKLGLETLDLMGYPTDRIRVVLNRANTSVGITGRDVVNVLGKKPDVLVPSSRDVTRSVNEGQPIVISQKRSEAARAFTALADLFSAGTTNPTNGTSQSRKRLRFTRSRG